LGPNGKARFHSDEEHAAPGLMFTGSGPEPERGKKLTEEEKHCRMVVRC
jgi:hypothetical protein